MGNHRRLLTLALAAAGVLLVGCGNEDGGTAPPPARIVASVSIAPPAGPLVSFGEVVSLSATVLDQNDTPFANPSLVWTSMNPDVATVGPTGRVVAIANGQARVTASASNVSDTVAVVVSQQVASVEISFRQPVLELIGDTVSAFGEPVDARGNRVDSAGAVTWSGSGAVTVQPSGLVAAVGFGRGTVTATSDSTSTSSSLQVVGNRFFLSDGTLLRYDLDLPDSTGGPFPAIIWVHGSGRLDRNAQRLGTDPLVPHGLAVLRYDKRGVGESGGSFNNNNFSQMARDAANGLKFLARLPQVDTSLLGMMGNSQGGWLVPMAAVTIPDMVKYMMFWSGPTVSVGLEIFYSALAEGTTTPLDSVYAQLGNFNGVPIYDPLADLSSLDIPALWQYGELDRSIPMRLDVQRLSALQAQGKPFEIVTWPFGDHSLRDTRINQFYDVWSEYLRFMRAHGILPPGS